VCLDETIPFFIGLAGWLFERSDFHSLLEFIFICFYCGLDYEFPLDGRENIGRYHDDNDDE
jgi:hypothetical protein